MTPRRAALSAKAATVTRTPLEPPCMEAAAIEPTSPPRVPGQGHGGQHEGHGACAASGGRASDIIQAPACLLHRALGSRSAVIIFKRFPFSGDLPRVEHGGSRGKPLCL